MRKPLAVVLAIIATLLFLMILGVSGYFLLAARPTLVFFADQSYLDTSLSFGERLDLYHSSIDKGWFLAIEELPMAILGEKTGVKELIGKTISTKKALMAVYSPLITALIASEDSLFTDGMPMDASDTGSVAPLMVGMGLSADQNPYFDIALVSTHPDVGWSDAAQALQSQTKATPLLTAVLYEADDPDSTADALLFAETLKDSHLMEFPQRSEGSRNTQVAATMGKLRDTGVLTVVCPYVASLDAYIGDPRGEGLQWVVDDLYSQVIPSGNLLGTVGDDLVASLEPLFAVAMPSVAHTREPITLPLVRTYRKNGKGFRNWF